MGESLQTPPAQPPDSDPLPCPQCGYDLRASLADHCSECGQTIDRSTLGITCFPWSARHGVRNYLKTIWLITINSRRLRFETLKNQNLAHARSFQRITTFVVALALGGSGAALLAADPAIFAAPIPTGLRATWREDLLLPWLAGANLRPVIPVMLLFVAIHLTSVHHRLFRLKSAPAPTQDRASAIACYGAAPLAWLLPLAIFSAADIALLISGAVGERGPFMWVAIVAVNLAIILFPLTFYRILQWALRVRDLGLEFSLVIGPQLIGLWLLVYLFYLGLLPWCIGLTWLAID